MTSACKHASDEATTRSRGIYLLAGFEVLEDAVDGASIHEEVILDTLHHHPKTTSFETVGHLSSPTTCHSTALDGEPKRDDKIRGPLLDTLLFRLSVCARVRETERRSLADDDAGIERIEDSQATSVLDALVSPLLAHRISPANRYVFGANSWATGATKNRVASDFPRATILAAIPTASCSFRRLSRYRDRNHISRCDHQSLSVHGIEIN